MKKTVVGLMGSSSGTLTKEVETAKRAAREIGEEVARLGYVLCTGEANGLPYEGAAAAREAGGLTIGFAPEASQADQDVHPSNATAPSDIVVYTGFGLKGRNILSIRTSDIVIIVSGSIGTLNELTIAYDEGKIIGILTGTGGVADNAENIIAMCNKRTKAKIEYNSDARALIAQCAAHL